MESGKHREAGRSTGRRADALRPPRPRRPRGTTESSNSRRPDARHLRRPRRARSPPEEKYGSRVKPGMSAPLMARNSVVKVRTGVCHSPVAEGNCVAQRRGGEQPEANWRSVVKRTRFGGVLRRACSFMAKPGSRRSRWRWRQKRRSCTPRGWGWNVGKLRCSKRGDPGGEVNAGRESEPSWYRWLCESAAEKCGDQTHAQGREAGR